MEFEMSDWTVDSNVLQLDKQLFGLKDQVTVSTVFKESKKGKQQEHRTKEQFVGGVDVSKTKSLKTEKLKQFKGQKGTEKLPKGDISCNVEIENGKNGKSSKKKKRKLDNITKEDNLKTASKKMKLNTAKTAVVDTGSVNVENTRQEMSLESADTKLKRKKKKKSISKKNKYKHLDEERARIKSSVCDKHETPLKSSTEGIRSSLFDKHEPPLQSSIEGTEIKPQKKCIDVMKKKRKKVKKVVQENSRKQDIVDANKLENSKKKNGQHSSQIVDSFNQTKEKEEKQHKSDKNLPFKLSTLQKVLSDANNVPQKIEGTAKKGDTATGTSPGKGDTSTHAGTGTNAGKGNKSTHAGTGTRPGKGDKSSHAGNSTNTETPANKPVSLRERMLEQLKSARFRYINEQLYTQTGSEAAKLFKQDEESFHCYHQGFQNQVEKWPTNPVDIIIKQIKERPSSLVVGDFGCGDAKIARNLTNKVHSFDLVALNKHVTVCNIEKVPLKSNSLDIAVFCLSLMGTNLTDYLKEANRVMKNGGILMIAEVTSRIQKIGKFIRNIERMGFEVINKDTSNKMFILVDLKKIGTPGAALPEIHLDPCVYKRR